MRLISLGEGDTPLVEAPRLAKWVGVRRLYLKCEGMNPTGSFKDRGMVVAVSRARARGARVVLCASTGNTAASAAAYAARAGLRCVILLPRGSVASAKIRQALAAGAQVVSVDAGFDRTLSIARRLSERYAVALVNSVNPDRLEGQATAAYEVCDVLGGVPDVLALPVGNGGNITAYWMGFRRYRKRGKIKRFPRMLGVQAAGAAPLVLGRPVSDPHTVATAIRIGHPATWEPALAAAHESGGAIRAEADECIMEAHRSVARLEGVFCELASAAAVAGLRGAVAEGLVASRSLCVCVLTGHGLKDAAQAVPAASGVSESAADVEAVAGAIGLERTVSTVGQGRAGALAT